MTPEQKELRKEWEVFYIEKLKALGFDFSLSIGKIDGKHFSLPEWMSYYRLRLNKRGLLFHGNTGTGKTFSAQMIRKIIQIKYTDEAKLKNLWKTSRDAFSEKLETEYVNSKNDVIIDEMFSEKEVVDYGEKSNISEKIIQVRYNLFKKDGSITIMTTNSDEDEMLKKGGDRAMSRLKEMCTFVVMDGEDLRKNL